LYSVRLLHIGNRLITGRGEQSTDWRGEQTCQQAAERIVSATMMIRRSLRCCDFSSSCRCLVTVI